MIVKFHFSLEESVPPEEDLKTVWICIECGRNFLFYSDVKDHEDEFHHSRIMMCRLESGKKKPPLFVYGTAKLDFRVDGESAQVVLKYRYYPFRQDIKYLNVEYTNPKLRQAIEGNPSMMKNIDNHIRNKLKKNMRQ